VYENRVLRKICGPKRDKATMEWKRLNNEKVLVCTPHQIFSGDQIKKNEMGGTCGRQDMCIQGFGGGDLIERDHLEDLGIDGSIILKWIFKKWDRKAWTGLLWLRTGTGGRHL
jgi:hypothetical protein